MLALEHTQDKTTILAALQTKRAEGQVLPPDEQRSPFTQFLAYLKEKSLEATTVEKNGDQPLKAAGVEGQNTELSAFSRSQEGAGANEIAQQLASSLPPGAKAELMNAIQLKLTKSESNAVNPSPLANGEVTDSVTTGFLVAFPAGWMQALQNQLQTPNSADDLVMDDQANGVLNALAERLQSAVPEFAQIPKAEVVDQLQQNLLATLESEQPAAAIAAQLQQNVQTLAQDLGVQEEITVAFNRPNHAQSQMPILPTAIESVVAEDQARSHGFVAANERNLPPESNIAAQMQKNNRIAEKVDTDKAATKLKVDNGSDNKPLQLAAEAKLDLTETQSIADESLEQPDTGFGLPRTLSTEAAPVDHQSRSHTRTESTADHGLIRAEQQIQAVADKRAAGEDIDLLNRPDAELVSSEPLLDDPVVVPELAQEFAAENSLNAVDAELQAQAQSLHQDAQLQNAEQHDVLPELNPQAAELAAAHLVNHSTSASSHITPAAANASPAAVTQTQANAGNTAWSSSADHAAGQNAGQNSQGANPGAGQNTGQSGQQMGQNLAQVMQNLAGGGEQRRDLENGLRQQAQVRANDEALVKSSALATGAATEALSGERRASLPPSMQSIPLPVRHPQWGQALGQRINYMVNAQVQQAQITLNPEKLGPIQIKLHFDRDQQMQLSVVAQHGATRDAIDASIPRLREMLEQSGINLASVDVSTGESFAEQQTAEQENSSTSFIGANAANDGGVEEDNRVATVVSDSLVDFYA